MSKPTAAQAVAAMEYWVGYYEKSSSSYATTRAKSAFAQNKGSNNYTYAGYLCGVQGQAWCAAQVSTAIYEACGSSKTDAKAVMHGVWPYTVCNQVWDAAPDNMKYWSHHQRWTLGKGYRTSYKPVPGDIMVFSSNGTTREHTGMVYAVDDTYVYTIEGNSGNMCRKRSYLLTSSYLYGWVRPNYAAATSASTGTGSAGNTATTVIEQYGAVCCKDPELHILSKGVAGPEVKTIQRIIYASGIDKTLSVDGDFGAKTKAGVIELQKRLGLSQDGIVGKETWTAALKKFN